MRVTVILAFVPSGVGLSAGLPEASSHCFATLKRYRPSFSLVSLLFVTVTVVLALNDSAFAQRRIFADLDVAAPVPAVFESLDAGCERLGAECGLTVREVEVLQMLVKGRSKSYIAETLFISENTVRSHSKHIYQKLGVHSKQEVLDLLGLGD